MDLGSDSGFNYDTDASSCNGRLYPPIGVFWDIENCHVPKGKSAMAVVQCVREKFFEGHREAEFVCVCDIQKENKDVIQELNNAQVTVIHVCSTSKNAADYKISQCLRRFADVHTCPATVVLISGDIHFAADISDLRYRKQFTIILLHNANTPEALSMCANESHQFYEMLADLPQKTPKSQVAKGPWQLLISNLPLDRDTNHVRNRLKQLSDNCGGRIVFVKDKYGLLEFQSPEASSRARIRMDREDVFGNIISVNYPNKDCASDEDLSLLKSKQNCVTTPRSSLNGPMLPKGLFPPPPLPPYPGSLISKPATMDLFPSFYPLPVKTTQGSPPLANALFDVKLGECSPTMYAGIREACSTPWSRGSPKQVPMVCYKQDEKTPEGARRIRGAHKGAVSEEEINYPNFPYGGTKWPQTLATQFGPWAGHLPERAAFNGNILETYQMAEPVELLIYNLDQSIGVKEMKRVLLHVFREHVMVLHVSVVLNGDNTLTAVVKVPSMQDGQYAISQLHRKRIGAKRILISVASAACVPSLQVLRSEVYSLMRDIPSRLLPLFKFREMFEKRYRRPIGMSEFHKLRDIVTIHEESTSGRMIILNPEYRDIPSPASSEGSKEIQDILEVTRCEIHCGQLDRTKGWAELDEAPQMPNVRVSLKALAPRVHGLLHMHVGGIPISSFAHCYKCEFGELEVDNGESGVPLEHLVTCVPGVHIVKSALGVKKLQWVENKTLDRSKLDLRSVSPPLAGQLALFSRETTDLLKSQPYCRMLFNKFIPAYHHHFGRQCRVADYGFTKLLELLEALPHIVQVIGEGNKKLLTLTHRMQVKRFLADLLRILKSLSKKRLSFVEFPALYEQCLERKFFVASYGVCDVMDLLSDLPENSLVVSQDDDDTYIGIPQRAQTPVELEKTSHFAVDVVELLRHSPRCQMDFTKFIPAYHHHFGRQCRVAEYGFTKLVELFKAIPHIVDVKKSDDKEDKIIQLTVPEMLKIFGDQIELLLKGKRAPVPMNRLMDMFIQYQGYCVHPQDFGVSNISELLSCLDNIEVLNVGGCTMVMLSKNVRPSELSVQVRQILGQKPDGEMKFDKLKEKFERIYGFQCGLAEIADLKDVLVDEKTGILKLTDFSLLARDVALLLERYKGRVMLSQFEDSYLENFGHTIQAQRYGHSNISSLLRDIPEVVKVKGTGPKKYLQLQKSAYELITEETARNCLSKQFQDEPLSNNESGNLGKAYDTDGASDASKSFLQPRPPPLVTPASIFSVQPFAPSIPLTWMYPTMSVVTPPICCSMANRSPLGQWASSINNNHIVSDAHAPGNLNPYDLAQRADKGTFKPRLAANFSLQGGLEM